MLISDREIGLAQRVMILIAEQALAHTVAQLTLPTLKKSSVRGAGLGPTP
jgi:hypothetical protein